MVWAVDAQGLISNSITCINSTGVLFISINKRHSFFLADRAGQGPTEDGLDRTKKLAPTNLQLLLFFAAKNRNY